MSILIKSLCLLFVITLPTLGCWVGPDNTHLDLSGPTMRQINGKEILDSSFRDIAEANGWLTASDISTKLRDPKNRNVRVLDLSNNFIGDEGARDLSLALSGALYIPGTNTHDFPTLEMVNLSNNQLSSAGLIYLIPLLQKDTLCYLDITGNNGAASSIGRDELRMRLGQEGLDSQEISACLHKVIYLPHGWLKTHASGPTLQAHKSYYAQYKGLL